MTALYEQDFYAWCLEQAEALKEGDLSKLDWENLAEEIDSMGRRERKELRNRLIVLFCHLLKLKFQPEYPDKKSWINTVREQRKEINFLYLEDSPSLKYCIEEVAIRAYDQAVEEAIKETGKPIPKLGINFYMTLEEALTDEWFP